MSLLWLGCGTDSSATSVVLVVDASEALRAAATEARITTLPMDGEPETTLHPLGVDLSLPFTQPLQPIGGDASRRFHVAVELFDGTTFLGRKTAIGRFTSGERRYVELRFEDECGGGLSCRNHETCTEGACRPACVATTAERDGTPTPPQSCARFEKRIDFHDLQLPDGPLERFPVLVELDSDPDLQVMASADASDVGFVGATGEPLDHEIENFDPATGTLTAFVLVPSLTASSFFFLVFGGDGTMPENPDRVWGDYHAVYHMTDRQGVVIDSSASSWDGSSDGAEFNDCGPIAGGAYFNGNFDEAGVSSTSGSVPEDFLGVLTGGSFSMSVWFQLDRVVDQQYPVTTNPTAFTLVTTDARQIDACLYRNGDSSDRVCHGLTAGAEYALGELTHIVVVVDRDADTVQLFQDGAAFSGPAALEGAQIATQPAAEIGFSKGGARMQGCIDEVRFRRGSLTAGWIASAHRNQRSPIRSADTDDGFLIVGGRMDRPPSL
ncbi:MAG: LamG-like jellyroll fold domain-containing protein [Myxococcota bacterium]